MKYLLSASSKSTPKCSVEYFDINEKKKNDFFQLEMREMIMILVVRLSLHCGLDKFTFVLYFAVLLFQITLSTCCR